MLGDGFFQSNPAIKAEEPDTKTEVEAFLEHRLQEGVAGGLIDLPVNALIEAHESVDVGFIDFRQFRNQRFHQRAIGGAGAIGSQPGGVALELDPHLGKAMEVGEVDVADERPPMRDEGDQIFVSQSLQRLADRRSSQAELFAQPRLLDHRARCQLEGDDLVPDQQVGALTLRPSRAAFKDDGVQRRVRDTPPRQTSGREFARQTIPSRISAVHQRYIGRRRTLALTFAVVNGEMAAPAKKTLGLGVTRSFLEAENGPTVSRAQLDAADAR